ncbi:hypothetical protein [Mesorhizobium sp. RIZ17]|uniref:hypothetical protein n=1 Tax=Mesorhizobium sp. RIZ17 TaxID=3132743 RepID=UPI003DA7FF44
MPRAGGVYSAPPGTKGSPNTTIESAKYNALVDDLVADANAARPVTAGGSGSNTAVGAADAFSPAGTDMASAATVNLANSTGTLVNITGTVTITALGTVAAGAERVLVFGGALTLTHNATSLILPGAANIGTAAGDIAVMRSLGGGNWRCIGYQRASGQPLLYNIISPAALAAGNTNDYSPAGLATALVLRLTGNGAGSALTGIAASSSSTFLYVSNIGAANVTLLGNNTGSLAPNRFLINTPIILQPGQSINLWYDSASTGWRVEEIIAASPTAAARKNLKIATTSIAAVTITADQLVLEDTLGNTYRASSVNVSYATGSAGVNGLDSGTVTASNWYHEWVIFNPTTTTLASLISLSSTAPTMPAGYTFKARVGASYYDASAKLRFKVQYDRRAQIVVGTNPSTALIAASGTSGSPTVPTWTAVAVGGFVPPTAATVRLALSGFSANPNAYIIAAPNNSYGAATSSTNPPPLQAPVKNSGEAIGIYSTTQGEFMLESTNIYYASASTGSALAVVGWEDNL